MKPTGQQSQDDAAAHRRSGAPVSTDQARGLALALPEAVEQDHHGRPSFRIGGKIFATLWDERHINVMLDEPGIHTAVQNHPGSCAEVWWGKRLAAVRVDLDRAGSEHLSELLTDAWERRAPKRLISTDGSAPPGGAPQPPRARTA